MNSTGSIVMIYAISVTTQAREKHVLGKAHHQENYKLFDRLEGRTHSIVANSGLPFVVFYDHQRKGDSFGKRYASAFEELFLAGFDQVISVGNDIPDLHEKHLLQASHYLAKHRVVLGPSKDGGDYLIALSREIFQPEAFAALPWRTDRLHLGLDEMYENNAPAFCLEYLEDIDSWDSLSNVLSGEAGNWLIFVKELIRRITTRFQVFPKAELKPRLQRTGLLRAPPNIF